MDRNIIRIAKNGMAMWFPEYSDILLSHKIIHTQNGGTFPKKINVSIGDKEFILEQGIEKGMFILLNKTRDQDCLTIVIDPIAKLAIIHEISGYHETCPSGSVLLELAIKCIKENKNILGVDKIVLTDNSLKSCSGIRVKFSDMYMLMYGKTWYMMHKFYPYDINTNNIDKDNSKYAILNYNILSNASINELLDLLNWVEKYGENIKEDLINKITIEPNIKIYKFIKWLLESPDKNKCYFFSNIYQKIIKILNLTSFRGKTFALNI